MIIAGALVSVGIILLTKDENDGKIYVINLELTILTRSK